MHANVKLFEYFIIPIELKIVKVINNYLLDKYNMYIYYLGTHNKNKIKILLLKHSQVKRK